MKTNNRKRKLKPYASYHVITTINRDEVIFDDVVSDLYQETVARCQKKYSFQTHNFSIIENHVHLMLTPGKNSPLPKIMQWINSVFAKAYNKRTGQSGHVWKERYFSTIIETAKQFIEIFEYIVKHPLKANLVQHAKDFRHSGLHYYIHKRKSIITEEPIISKLYEQCKDFHR